MKIDIPSLFSLKGKTAVLTGASGFLGRTFAKALLASGARLVAISRSGILEKHAQTWAREFGPGNIAAYRVDMYDLDAFSRLLISIAATERSVDILVNNAHELGPRTGFNVPEGGIEGASFDMWMRNLTGGVYWAALAIQTLGEVMKAHRHGSIVNIATMYSIVAPSPQIYNGTDFMNPPGYSASKAALLAFTRYVASFWGAFNIRANAILPGSFPNRGGSSENAVPENDRFLERLNARTCLGRVGKPEELVGALIYLASDASSYVTGHGLVVDGGWTVT